MSQATVRFFLMSGMAMLVAVVGFLVDGELGSFLRLVGTVGVILTGLLWVLTGDVLLERERADDASPTKLK